jgi:ribosome maturation factor RimP
MQQTALNKYIETAVKDCGLILHGVAKNQASITIYIKKEQDGVSVKDCESVIKQLGYLIDIDDMHIEVESSGYAPLFVPEHYKPHLNKVIKVQTKEKTIHGVLLDITEHGIVLLYNSDKLSIAWDKVIKSIPLMPGVKS